MKGSSRRRLWLAVALTSVSLLLFAFSVAGPVAGDGRYIAEPLLSSLCHRMPDRSLELPWGTTGLCARCTAFWLGLGAGSMFFCRYGSRIPFWTGAVALLPLLADGTLQLHTEYQSSNAVRVVTGLAAGLGVALVFFGKTKEG